MTSEIRANTLKNRVGLGTISFTNTGPVVSGIITATGADINGDLDVDGHTNLDNLSVAGVTTHNEDVWFKGATSGRDVYWDKSANELRFNDNANIFIGNSRDAFFGHDGSSTRLQDQYGHFFIGGNLIQIKSGNLSEEYARMDNTSKEVKLYHNSIEKFTTKSTGIVVHGTTTTTGLGVTSLAVAGVSTFSGDIDVDGHTNLDNVSVVGVTTITANNVIGLNVENSSGGGAQTTIRSKSTVANASNFVRSESSDNKYIGLLKYGTGHSAYGALAAGGGAVYANSSVPITIMSDGGYINFATGGNTERVRITSDGKIGIGNIASPVNNVEIRTDAHGEGVTIKSTGNTSNALTFDANRGTQGVIGVVYGRWNGTTIAQMSFVSGDDGTNKNDGYITFNTESDASNGNVNATERVRITSGGDLLLGNHGSRIFDDSSGTNVVVDIYGGTTAGKRGILALGGRTGSDDADIGTIQFVNENNNVATAANHVQSKLVASIDVKSETTDSNAGSDSGGHLLFSTKPETGAISERLRITSSGDVAITTRGSVEGVSKLNVEIPARTTAFSASDGDTWHDVLIENPGDATTNAVGLCFQVTGDSYHKNAGTGIAAVKNGTASDYGADLVFITRGQNVVASEKMRIDSNGYVTKPNHPSFHARRVNNASATENPLVFDSVHQNNGSHYKSSGTDQGKFVAPVSGVYLFYWTAIKTSSGTVTRLYINVDGSHIYSNMHLRLQEQGNYSNGSMQAIVNLNAGQKVHISLEVGSIHGNEYTHFGGYLIH